MYSSPKLCFLIQVTLKLHVNRKDVGCFCLLQYLCALKSCSTCKSHSKQIVYCDVERPWLTLERALLAFIHSYAAQRKVCGLTWIDTGFRGSPDCWQWSHWVMFDTGSVLQVIHALFILFVSWFSYSVYRPQLVTLL